VANDIGAANGFSQFSEAKYTSVSKQAQQLAGSSDHQKIERSASEFESILLASWLESAEKSFATAPGGDDDKDADPGKNQFQSYAVQAVATALTKAGGIGIAAMIASGLTKRAAAEQQSDPVGTKSTSPALGPSAVKVKM
jgi:Rod binding domain-containing protein